MPKTSRTASPPSRTKTRWLTNICTSLSGRTCSELAVKAREAFAQGTDLVEFRIDLLKPPVFEEIEAALSRFSERSIFTVRPVAQGGGFEWKESVRLELISRLAELTPAYFDVELNTLEVNRSISSKGLGRTTIVSWHDQILTPGRARLLSIASKAASYGGLVKVVPTARNAVDNLTILSLYDEPGPPPIAFCMGIQGLFSRVMAMEMGSPIAYASLPDAPTASGQLPLRHLLAIRRRLQAD